MPVWFRECCLPPLGPITATAPAGAVIGVLGDDGSGKRALLEVATGASKPLQGEAGGPPPALYLGPEDPFRLEQSRTLGLYHNFATKDAVTQARAAMELELLRRRGGTALIVSHELSLLEQIADEIWWLHRGRLHAKGDPREITQAYRHHIAAKQRELACGATFALPPALRRGDGRARLISVEACNSSGQPTYVWTSGEPSAVKAVVEFAAPVADPVVGILVRTRIGFDVFGTNTELEGVRFGPCQPGDKFIITFRFPCHLCPQEYTITVASHDPDGVWHDWMEEGIAVQVVDTRYTAGVANLHAMVEVARMNP
jgi:lipopolysaccharide transport system ATP-binding protein